MDTVVFILRLCTKKAVKGHFIILIWLTSSFFNNTFHNNTDKNVFLDATDRSKSRASLRVLSIFYNLKILLYSACQFITNIEKFMS